MAQQAREIVQCTKHLLLKYEDLESPHQKLYECFYCKIRGRDVGGLKTWDPGNLACLVANTKKMLP